MGGLFLLMLFVAPFLLASNRPVFWALNGAFATVILLWLSLRLLDEPHAFRRGQPALCFSRRLQYFLSLAGWRSRLPVRRRKAGGTRVGHRAGRSGRDQHRTFANPFDHWLDGDAFRHARCDR